MTLSNIDRGSGRAQFTPEFPSENATRPSKCKIWDNLTLNCIGDEHVVKQRLEKFQFA